ncbi:hypothetical protein TPHA_0M01310 [Tetrapisispora phaffii CBS 4417]|uniref:Endoplasmic reticulum lectin n=1 Tax=Tetrapisispora phaffii (strain ATCC 24235 / CBS 4417 / NBRC 1672 / NRRL Y-8282 / UCD 70-5) TaxID=1071381 RepID=G8C0J1_TETPH|nr:hypothetical protein TPHA_0M01310 [Tetrapisispora phaffii CBS 4417]CCE65706.1 hypothetical protein TPHA_0M01310 [Tetrapisispora phaffii CBS 4417]
MIYLIFLLSLINFSEAIITRDDQKFSIHYLPYKSFNENILQNKKIIENGDLIKINSNLCYVPKTKNDPISEFSNSSVTTNFRNYLKDNLRESINIIEKFTEKQQLNNRQCLNYSTGFWSYEFCNGQVINQIHKSVDDFSDHSMVNKLGEVENSLNQFNEKILNYYTVMIGRKNGYYITEFASNGDICDLNGLPRTIEIQYSCGFSTSQESGTPNIQFLTEPKNCNYQIGIAIPELCKLDIFKPNNIDPFDIDDYYLKETNAKESQEIAFENSLVCLQPHDEEQPLKQDSEVVKEVNSQKSVIDLFYNFKPFFIGSGVYFLKHKTIEANMGSRKPDKLLFSGDISKLDSKLETMLPSLIKLDSFFESELFNYEDHDSFKWIGDIVNLQNKVTDTVLISVTYNTFNNRIERTIQRSYNSTISHYTSNFIEFTKFQNEGTEKVNLFANTINKKTINNIEVLEMINRNALISNKFQNFLSQRKDEFSSDFDWSQANNNKNNIVIQNIEESVVDQIQYFNLEEFENLLTEIYWSRNEKKSHNDNDDTEKNSNA